MTSEAAPNNSGRFAGGPASRRGRQDRALRDVEGSTQLSERRSEEAVNRVVNTLSTFFTNSGQADGPTDAGCLPTGPCRLFRDKDYLCDGDECIIDPHDPSRQAENSASLSSGPTSSGDFDVLVVVKQHGCLLLEVKATGDVDDSKDTVARKLLEKPVKQLEKGRRALGLLDRDRARALTPLTTLALPNLRRQLLVDVLDDQPALFEYVCRGVTNLIALSILLASCLPSYTSSLAVCVCPSVSASARTSRDVAAACLCADDLPAKDRRADPADPELTRAIGQWWSAVLRANTTVGDMGQDVYDLVVSRMTTGEDAKTPSQRLGEAMAAHQRPRFLSVMQNEAVECADPRVFLSGAPGTGKSLVLACKARRWLEAGERVFLVRRLGQIDTQPSSAHLRRLVVESRVGHGDQAEAESQLIDLDIHDDTDVDRLIKDRVLAAVSSGPVEVGAHHSDTQPASAHLRRLVVESRVGPEDQAEVESQLIDLDIHYDTDVGRFIKDLAAVSSGPVEVGAHHSGGNGVNFIMDEISKKTFNQGKHFDFISAVERRLPEARIWCAGVFPDYKPEAEGMREIQLHVPYRCPAKVRRILAAVEPVLVERVYDYCPVETGLLDGEVPRRLPGEPRDTPDVHFISHGGHGPGEVWHCDPCCRDLATHLAHLVPTGADRRWSEASLQQGDVLVAVAGTKLYRRLPSLQRSSLYTHLAADPHTPFDVRLVEPGDPYDPDSKAVTIMHVRSVAGIEKGVVVFLPWQTYRDHCHGSQACTCPPGDRGEAWTCSLEGDSRCSRCQTCQCPERDLRRLRGCNSITQDQKERLATLGRLNRHWLWYAASRSVGHLVICHY